jgi:hypothetical protein
MKVEWIFRLVTRVHGAMEVLRVERYLEDCFVNNHGLGTRLAPGYKYSLS